MTGAQMSHVVTLWPRQTGEYFTEEIMHRLYCHLVVSLLPPPSLPEACESLQEIYKYYQTLPPAPLPALPHSEPIQAKWGLTYERPEFHVAED